MGADARAWCRAGVQGLAAGLAAVAGAWVTVVAANWCRYGRIRTGAELEGDRLLDRFMPRYEVCERHRIHVRAPAAVTLAAACEQDLLHAPVVRTIFRAREMVMGGTPAARAGASGLLAQTLDLGWGVLATIPGREVVVGAVTRPWEANVTFHSVPPDDFAAFAEPGFVKIAWTLGADPVDEQTSIFFTETRAIATDPAARARFRRYWAWASPGIALIRRLSLSPLRREAERRASQPAPSSV